MKTLREEVRKFYKPYYRDGDEAHLIDHADDVCDLALKINQELTIERIFEIYV